MVREGRLSFRRRHVCHHRRAGKRAISLQGRELNPVPVTYRFAVAPSHRRVKLSPATSPHFEGSPPIIKTAQG